MHARDAAGRQVSLLNDDYSLKRQRPLPQPSSSYHHTYPPPPPFARSESSSPNTPELLRSDSYDSQMSNEPISPLTPAFEFGRYSAAQSDVRPHYDDYMEYSTGSKRPSSIFAESRSSSYEDDAATSPTATTPASERPGKRYPCRYRDSHGCEKTFTTSGHASRHSKIHTAEKAVPCTYPGCSKKFTRADNMKQHLETHYKEKSRPSLSASDRRSSTASKSSSSSRKAAAAIASLRSTPPLPSPGGAWDMRALNLPLMSRPGASRVPSGLDALAMAVACQEGA
ncbi:Transcriptional regulator NRG1 [Coniochaeta hoffmannii]|uniref:Transcriptional regulator NRG1 n=1 Tax=Coniochaeta hoffmannii TaxID=91930 RepID=A0AA38VCZ6_9PEZI|nr:Transcriptional regulator NRG1 [Coniochaeta hoffmannii]